jgi:hypothetical protein
MTYRKRVRGSTTDRGYGYEWRKITARWAAQIAAGTGYCTAPTCVMSSRWIRPGSAWDGGHDEQRRPRGPEHRKCNRAAAARKVNAMRRARGGQRPPRPLPSRSW